MTHDIRNNPEEIKRLANREYEKYKKSGDIKYFISSKQVGLVLYSKDKQKQIPLFFELMKLNNGRFDYISMICNNNLAAYFEKTAPDWALKYVNAAIEASENMEEKYSLEHLYHFKGRVLYNEGKYHDAMILFQKALEIFKERNETLYIASMYNNFGACYDKLNQLQSAITETEKAIQLLGNKPNLNNNEKTFLNYMKEGLAQYYMKEGNYRKAEELLLSEFTFSIPNKSYGMTISSSKCLLSIYESQIINPEAKKEIIQSLEKIEPKVHSIENEIGLNGILQDYYLKTDNTPGLKKVSLRLLELCKRHETRNRAEIEANLEFADQYLIKSANQESDYERRKNMYFLIGMILLVVLFSIITSLLIRMKKRKDIMHDKEKELFAKEKIISENEREILEKNILLQNEKINNLYLNLNLKTETEREFLNNIKKIKKLKNVDTEEVLRDLQLKMNNLIMIDKKNNDLINESSNENRKFIENLSQRYPGLTDQELQLCVYFKLDLTAKEVSLLEKLTVGSIRVYKTKIKTKLGLGKEDSLSETLNNI